MFLAIVSVAATGCHRPPGKANVVVVLLDTVRADRMSLYGYERDTTPFLRLLAGDGTNFTSAYSQGLWTRTSVPSLLTSSYVSEHGNVSVAPPIDQLPACFPDVVEVLKRAGYVTAAFTGPVLPGSYYSDYGWHRGFDYMAGDWYTHKMAAAASAEPRVLRQIDMNIVREVRDWVAAHAGRPFFAYIHLMGAHGPYETAPQYESAFVDHAVADCFRRSFQHSYGWDKKRAPAHPEEVRYLRDAYDAAVRFTDDNVRQIADELRAEGLLSDTIMVVVADHGENILEDGIQTAWLHGPENPPREPITHVPLVFSGPGVPRGVVTEDVMQIDVAPTLLGLLGISAPREMRGVNLFDSTALRRRDAAFSESDYTYRAKAVVSGQWKYVRTFADLKVPEYALAHYTGEALFNIALDPAEHSNAAFNRPDQVRQMRRVLEGHILRGQSGWHVRFEGTGTPAEYELRLHMSEPLRRIAVQYVNPDAALDFAELRRRSLLGGSPAGPVAVPEQGLHFSSDAKHSPQPNTIVVFGGWARVVGDDRGLTVSLRRKGKVSPTTTVSARGRQAQWTPVWAYAAAGLDVLLMDVGLLPGNGRVEFRDPFISVATDFYDFNAVANATDITVPIRLTDGAIDVNFDSRSSNQSVEIQLLENGHAVEEGKVRIGAGHRSRSRVRVAPEAAFVSPSDLQFRAFPPGTVSVYFSGCCPGGDMVSDAAVANEARKRLRSLGYLR